MNACDAAPFRALGARVNEFIKKFVREAEGIWVCTAAAEFELPGGRVQVAVGTRFTRGTRYMGIDVAQLLDEQYHLGRPAV